MILHDSGEQQNRFSLLFNTRSVHTTMEIGIFFRQIGGTMSCNPRSGWCLTVKSKTMRAASKYAISNFVLAKVCSDREKRYCSSTSLSRVEINKNTQTERLSACHRYFRVSQRTAMHYWCTSAISISRCANTPKVTATQFDQTGWFHQMTRVKWNTNPLNPRCISH